MAGPISPFFRSPFMDITGGLVSHQVPGSVCGPIELEVMECLEAFGLERGLKRCKCLITDFKECQTKTKEYMRFMLMRAERDRKIAEGKLTGNQKYLNPVLDSY